jgi:hypothetical protein
VSLSEGNLQHIECPIKSTCLRYFILVSSGFILVVHSKLLSITSLVDSWWRVLQGSSSMFRLAMVVTHEREGRLPCTAGAENLVPVLMLDKSISCNVRAHKEPEHRRHIR